VNCRTGANRLQNAVTVVRPPLQSLQNQQIERALQQPEKETVAARRRGWQSRFPLVILSVWRKS
jgi:hypothetical protein